METDWLAMPDGYRRMFVQGDWITQPALYRVRADGGMEFRQLHLYAWQLPDTVKFQWAGYPYRAKHTDGPAAQGRGNGDLPDMAAAVRAAESWAAELLEPENEKEN